ncbi:SDR family oxidoreductase [Streptomyces antimycoticus]|uniref:Oxidoreductase n=1 Tax=Streptomyces antimycoticus TaxID=68175 RepID=A0A4D4JRF8_9ACTN|nr:SDR family oxidoreductase [Streptomyces antimycoticus]GDY39311.1 oxidoreductase [Streptomyces antimycoticus]
MSGVEGKVVAITGASSGIGAATATYLTERGARLVLGARREDRLQAVVDRITAQGGSAVGTVIDVTRREDLQRLTDTAVDRFGRLDVLVSNAGTMAVSPFDELRQDDWDAMVATHITGLPNGIGAALPRFRRQRSGQFVNIASTAAYVVKSPQAVYAVTKTAVKVLTEGLRQESGPDLRVTLVSPGFTNTEGVGKGASPQVAAAAARQRDEMAIPPSAIASAIGYAIEQPAGIDISEVVVRPTAQA